MVGIRLTVGKYNVSYHTLSDILHPSLSIKIYLAKISKISIHVPLEF